MHSKDEYASFISFLFSQDRKSHPPPKELLERILQWINRKQIEVEEKEKWRTKQPP